MDEIGAHKYEEQFTAFIDLLGFSQFSKGTDEMTRLKVLAFLISLTSLRGEFDIKSTTEGSGTQTYLKPAVSTFSDHIVISYPLDKIAANTGSDESMTALHVLHNFNQLLTRIASAALSIGFLIRGGATIGKLHHSGGVVFGEALVEAYQIESRTSVYPRVVLSSKIYGREAWMKFGGIAIRKGNDGLYFFDHFSTLVLSSALPGEKWQENMIAWFEHVVALTSENLRSLEEQGKLTELSKWAWFAHEFRASLERLPEGSLKAFGLSLNAIPWKS